MSISKDNSKKELLHVTIINTTTGETKLDIENVNCVIMGASVKGDDNIHCASLSSCSAFEILSTVKAVDDAIDKTNVGVPGGPRKLMHMLDELDMMFGIMDEDDVQKEVTPSKRPYLKVVH